MLRTAKRLEVRGLASLSTLANSALPLSFAAASGVVRRHHQARARTTRPRNRRRRAAPSSPRPCRSWCRRASPAWRPATPRGNGRTQARRQPARAESGWWSGNAGRTMSTWRLSNDEARPKPRYLTGRGRSRALESAAAEAAAVSRLSLDASRRSAPAAPHRPPRRRGRRASGLPSRSLLTASICGRKRSMTGAAWSRRFCQVSVAESVAEAAASLAC